MSATQSKSHGSDAEQTDGQLSQMQSQAKSIFATQKELLSSLEQMNEHWFARAKSEAEQAATLADKLASARSLPDVTGVYRDWLSYRIHNYVEDSNHLLENMHRLFQTGSRLVRNGKTARA